MRWLWVLALVSGLAACGSDDDDKTASETPPVEEEPPVLSISGTITSAAGITYDSDLNDKASLISGTNTSNDTLIRAQRINNVGTIHGFASYRSSGYKADRFGSDFDASDTYRVTLTAGQRIQLQVVDFERQYSNPETACDLDLVLLNRSGEPVAYSDGTGEFEQVVVPATAEYFLRVEAYEGISKYVLNLFSETLFDGPVPASGFVSGDVIVKFKPGATLSAQQIRSQYAGTLSHHDNSRATLLRLYAPTFQPAHYGVASLDDADRTALAQMRTLRAIKDLRKRSDVEYAEPNYIYHASAEPNDAVYRLQWHYGRINLTQAWDITTGAATPPVIVAVIDTGVYLDHPDLTDNLIDGYDFISDPDNALDGDGLDADPDDPGDSEVRGESSFHGTHVAGTIAATSNNGEGVAGVSWYAQIMPLRTLGRMGGTVWDIMEAVRFAAGLSNASGTVPPRKADVINMSLGGAQYSLAFQNVIDAARTEGVIIVAAAGNESSAMPSYPASYDGVISVAATNASDQPASYSNYGRMIDVAAPGGEMSEDANSDTLPDGVYSTWVNDISGTRVPSYTFKQGTSMATPHVAGVLALMKARFPQLTPDHVDAVLAQAGPQTGLTNDVWTLGWDERVGWGLIDANKAVREADRLAGLFAAGDPLPVLPPRMVAQPHWLNFGHVASQSTQQQLIIRNVGGNQPVSIASITSSQDWLTVVANEIDGQGLGSYTVTADSTGLLTGDHSALITVSVDGVDDVDALTVPVTLVVAESPEDAQSQMAPQYVLLYDAVEHAVVDEYQTPVNSRSSDFAFYDVAPGAYYLMAGSDVDQDLWVCQDGETCGGWPNLLEMETFDYSGAPIADRDITVSVNGKLGLSIEGANDNSKGIARMARQNTGEADEDLSVIRVVR